MVASKTKIGLVVVLLLTFNLLLYAVFNRSHPSPKYRSEEDEEESKPCDPRHSIVFLKTRKCASATVQNILLRYGLNHHLDILLPNQENYLGMPELTPINHISRNLQIRVRQYHVSTHYKHLDFLTIQSFMTSEPALVTILRDPVSLYKSLYAYYDLEKHYNQTLSEYIKRPDAELYAQDRVAYGIGFNQMSWDLGLEPKHFESATDTYSFIRFLESQFDLVMIAEYLEASLVLLSNLMCWPLKEVASIPFTIHYYSKEITLQKPEINRIYLLNKADNALYSYFLRRFKASIRDFGEALMVDKVIELIDINLHLYRRCIMKATVQQEGEEKYAHVKYVLNPDFVNDTFCKYATMEETEFTEELRYVQEIRWKVLHKLRKLLE